MTSKSSDLPVSILTAKSRTAATVLPDDSELEEITAPPAAAPFEGGGTKSLTVKIDLPRYKRMQLAKVNKQKTTQDILSEALDLWFKKNDRPLQQ